MTNLLLAAAVLAASLAADPAPAAAKKEAPPKPTAAAPAKPVEKSAGIKDAISALMGPCSPEQATGKVTGVEVLDGNALNARREKEKSTKPKADPNQRFIAVKYAVDGKTGQSVRQVSTVHMLTTEQAQALVGEKLCVFAE